MLATGAPELNSNRAPSYLGKADIVHETLRRAIITGKYRPGERLRQLTIAQELNVSPTPVREALRHLEAEGLVVHSPHQGVRVAEFSLSHMLEAYYARAVLEGLAARLAVVQAAEPQRKGLVQVLEPIQRRLESMLYSGNLSSWVALNDQFHQAILSAARADTVARLVTGLRQSLPRDTLGLIPGQAERTAIGHKAILEAVRAGDALRAEQAMRQHLEQAGVARVAFIRERMEAQEKLIRSEGDEARRARTAASAVNP